MFEVNEAAEVIHGVAHPDANIIFGAVIDDEMGDDVRVTVIAAGFERWENTTATIGAATSGATLADRAPIGGSGPDEPGAGSSEPSTFSVSSDSADDDLEIADVFADAESSDDNDDDGPDDEFDVPSFLR